MHIHLFLILHSFISTCYGNLAHDLVGVTKLGVEPDTHEAAETLMMISEHQGNRQESIMKPISIPQSSQSSHEVLSDTTPFENFRKSPSFKDNLINKEILTSTDPSPRFSIATQESRTSSLNKFHHSPATTEDESTPRSSIDTLSEIRGEFGTPDELRENRQYWQGRRTQSPKSPRKRPWGADFLTETNEAPATKVRKIVVPEGYAPLNTEKVLELFSNGATKELGSLTTVKEQLSPGLLAKYLQKGSGGSDYFTSTAPQREFISLGISVPAMEERTNVKKFLKFVALGNKKQKITEVSIKGFHQRARESAVDWQLLLSLENQAKFKFEGMLKALSDWNPQWTNEQSLERLNNIKTYIESHSNLKADFITPSVIQSTQKWENGFDSFGSGFVLYIGGYIKFLEPFKALSTDSKFTDPNIALFLRHTVKMLDKDSLVKIQELSKDLDDISSFARVSGSRFLENTGSLGKGSIRKSDDQRILNFYQEYAEGSRWLLKTQFSKDSLSKAVEARVEELKILNH
ncbi:uncharacterized protein MELLADRAFT_68178 [Melampsora larici-populina 98AG31]|uniref:Secreted protein n=1 Tax=Melampsora larici-populina (strain 98AG31 / pathotype 3-4-7) TaxID=747676 RepID=F4S5V2_MELLP|nr:uncharacterized protein MELLADRAFT_68178 [Melampsora larici-populina 98AG31]EGG00002.1 hypothetical protein MELLADRAFT_68178 [Melampsora larici-populina 98AG31]